MPGEPVTFEADHYRQARRELRDEGIVRSMYEELPQSMRAKLAIGAEPTGLMQMVLREYHNRGGQVGTHIGGPIQVLKEYAREEVSRESD